MVLMNFVALVVFKILRNLASMQNFLNAKKLLTLLAKCRKPT